MTDPALAVLFVVLVAQYPVAVVVSLDARRLGLRDPATYGLGIVVPAAGFVVVLYYSRNGPRCRGPTTRRRDCCGSGAAVVLFS